MRIALFLALLAAAVHAEETLEQHVDEAVKPYLENNALVGCVIGIVDGGKTFIKGYGRVSMTKGGTPDKDTIYEIGSISKVFTGILLASMMNDGQVELDQPVATLLPEGAMLEKAITLADLSTHRSGLPRLPDNFAPKDPTNPYIDYDAERLYAFLKTHKLRRAPGVAYEYSNLAAGLLGHALSLEAGKSYEALLKERIAGPLGMTSTVVALTDDLRARLAPPYTALRTPSSTWDFDSPTVGAGGIRSSVADMMLFLRANLNWPRNKVGLALNKAQEVQFRPKGGQAMALGWHVTAAGEHWHNGQTGGYHSYLVADVKYKRGIVILSNTGGPAVDQLGGVLLQRISGRIAKEVELDAKALDRFVGSYRFQGAVLTVTREENKLFAQITGQAVFPVFPTSGKEFFWKIVAARAVLQIDADGKVSGLTLHQGGRAMDWTKAE